MNNYIINPSIFYWMHVINVLSNVSTAFFILGVISIILCIIFWKVYQYWEEDKIAKIWYKALIISTVISIITGFIMIFVPDKFTCIEMLVARTATYENTQLTVQGIKEVVDYIVQAIQGVYN